MLPVFKERKMARLNLQTDTSSVLTGMLLLSGLILGTPATAAEAPAIAAIAEEAPAPDSLVGRSRFDWEAKEDEARKDAAREKLAKDKLRMKTHVGDAQPIDFQEFYPFPDPVPAKEPSEAKSYKTLYWIGATGVALVAGVAAYLIFSAEPESEPTVLAVQQF